MEDKEREFRTDDLEDILNEARQYEIAEDVDVEALLNEEMPQLSAESAPAGDGDAEAAVLDRDTIRLDSLREVLAQTASREPIREDAVSDDTVRLDSAAQAAILESVQAKLHAEKPETVRKFLAATAKGYQFAAENPDDAAVILHGYAPD